MTISNNTLDTGISAIFSEPRPSPERYDMHVNSEIEGAILGRIILEPQQIAVFERKLQEKDFVVPAHGMIFSAMLALRKRRQPIELGSLYNELKTRSHLDSIGGGTGLAELIKAGSSCFNVTHYANVIQDSSVLRRAIKLCTAVDIPGTGVEQLLSEAELLIRGGIATSHIHGGVLSIMETLNSTWEHLDKHSTDHVLVSGLATGLTELDLRLDGFHNGELIIIAGRPAMGKTAFALNVLRNVAIRHCKPTVFFTLDMSAQNITRNLLAHHARVDANKLRSRNLSVKEMKDLSSASEEMTEAPLWIDETSAITFGELCDKARQLKHSSNIQLIVIDWLQLITAASPRCSYNREQEVPEISRGLKDLAKELHVPIVALAQLSRKSGRRQDNRPRLSDIRGSATIEQDADVVLLLHRPDYYNEEDRPHEAEVIVAKHRNGPTCTVSLAFIGSQFRFTNLSINEWRS